MFATTPVGMAAGTRTGPAAPRPTCPLRAAPGQSRARAVHQRSGARGGVAHSARGAGAACRGGGPCNATRARQRAALVVCTSWLRPRPSPLSLKRRAPWLASKFKFVTVIFF